MAEDRLEAWRRAEALFDRIQDAPEAARAALLEQGCGGDQALRRSVESLLAAAEASADWLESPALTQASQEKHAEIGTTPERLGPWRLTGLLGRGGMGEVHAAQRVDGQFEQQVAIKLIRRDIEVSTQRFEAERRILARLDHPGIARLLDGGRTSDDRAYMVMERVDGEDLRSYCAGRSLDLHQRLALFGQIAAAVAHAHRHLVVHRDLKPANVLVTPAGQVKLLDFGIATLLASAGQAAAQTQVLMTPEFAAPELLEHGAITTAVDIYALGLLLHELLTGAPARALSGLPFTIALRQVLDRDLPRPSSQTRVLPPRVLQGDLDAIVAKALRHDPAQRYASAEALLDDLERWREQQPVLARGGARAYVLGRFLRRHRVSVLAAVLVLMAVVAGIGGVLWQARETAIQRDAARVEAARANAVRDYVLHMFRIASQEKPGSVVSAREVLDKAAARVREQFRDDPAAARSILLQLADLYYEMRDSPGAEALLRQYLQLEGESAEEIAVAQARLADVVYDAGRGDEARALLQQSLPVLARAPKHHVEPLIDARQLEATLIRDAGKAGEAVARFEELIAFSSAQFGPEHPKTAVMFNELGNTQLLAAQFAAAESAYRRSLEILEKSGQGDSADAVLALANLCDALLRGAQPEPARTCYERALPRQEALYGESFALISLLVGLGRTLLDRDEPAAALPPLLRANELARRYFSAEAANAQVIALMRVEALTRSGQGDQAAALIETEFGDAKHAEADAAGLIRGMVMVERARLELRRGAHARAEELAGLAAIKIARPHLLQWQGQSSLNSLRRELDKRGPGSG